MRMTRSKPVTLFVIRHGERVDHVDRSWGRTSAMPCDPPLTERGMAQAVKTGQHLQMQIMERVVSMSEAARSIVILASPLLRCLQTAHAIKMGLGKLGNGVTIRPELGLVEWLSEDYFTHPVTKSDILYYQPALAAAKAALPLDELSSDTDDDGVGPEAAPTTPTTLTRSKHQFITELPSYPESYQSMSDRAGALVAKLDAWTQRLTTPMSPIVILVTHGAVVNGVISGCLNEPFLTKVDPCAVSCLKKQFTGRWQPSALASTRHIDNL